MRSTSPIRPMLPERCCATSAAVSGMTNCSTSFRIPRAMLPRIEPSSGVVGCTHPSLFGAAVPIAGVAGDQQAAAFGEACFAPGSVKNTYGTGGFLLMNVGGEPRPSENRLITTAAWKLGCAPTQYALEGSVLLPVQSCNGFATKWALLNPLRKSKPLPAKCPDSGGVWFVPAFVGLGALFIGIRMLGHAYWSHSRNQSGTYCSGSIRGDCFSKR